MTHFWYASGIWKHKQYDDATTNCNFGHQSTKKNNEKDVILGLNGQN